MSHGELAKNKRQVSCVLDAEIVEWLKETAKEENRTVSNLVATILAKEWAYETNQKERTE